MYDICNPYHLFSNICDQGIEYKQHIISRYKQNQPTLTFQRNIALQLFIGWSGFIYFCLSPVNILVRMTFKREFMCIHDCLNGKVTFGKANLFSVLVTEEQFTHQRVSYPNRLEIFNKPLLRMRWSNPLNPCKRHSGLANKHRWGYMDKWLYHIFWNY